MINESLLSVTSNLPPLKQKLLAKAAIVKPDLLGLRTQETHDVGGVPAGGVAVGHVGKKPFPPSPPEVASFAASLGSLFSYKMVSLNEESLQKYYSVGLLIEKIVFWSCKFEINPTSL